MERPDEDGWGGVNGGRFLPLLLAYFVVIFVLGFLAIVSFIELYYKMNE